MRYRHCWIFVEIIIVLLQRATNHDSVEINNFFLGRTFYRLRLVRNLNGREFIICSGKVSTVYLLTDRNCVYKSQPSRKSNSLRRWHPVLFAEVGELLVGYDKENCQVDLGGVAVNWVSSIQGCVTFSTTEDRLRRSR